jgi:23S rRNA pseudouridine2605 synthase
MKGHPSKSRTVTYGQNIASLPRAVSKLGIASRSKSEELIRKGLVTVNGRVVTSPLFRVNYKTDKIEVENSSAPPAEKIYIMLNKPRGLVTSLSDDKGRDTVFTCFEGKEIPYVFPVGRLDKASEGLLLFTNDTFWGNKVTSPGNRIEKIYHVQINSVPGREIISAIKKGLFTGKDKLEVKNISVIRSGEKNSWVEIVLDEGKNRHIRNIFEALDIKVLRLIRIGIGPLRLGALPKGEFRFLTTEEISGF